MLGTRAKVGDEEDDDDDDVVEASLLFVAEVEEGGRMAAKVDCNCLRRLACADGDDGFEMAASR